MSDSRAYAHFSRKRLNVRQTFELLGFCQGMVADKKIVQSEAEALYAWLVSQEEAGNPDVAEMRAHLRNMLKDGVLDATESAKLMRLACALIDSRPSTPTSTDQVMDTNETLDDLQIASLLGLCRGLIADGKIDANEAAALRTWLTLHENSVSNPVMVQFYVKLEPVLKKSSADAKDNAPLLQLLSGLVGGQTEVGECLHATTLWLDDPPPKVVFENRKFCLTGKFAHGRRDQCTAEIKKRRGICQPNPTRDTNYVVIGSYGEGSWIQSAYGRKIERAIKLRANGRPLRIISEAHWLAALS